MNTPCPICGNLYIRKCQPFCKKCHSKYKFAYTGLPFGFGPYFRYNVNLQNIGIKKYMIYINDTELGNVIVEEEDGFLYEAINPQMPCLRD